jgi:heptosyltransferase-2
MRVGIFLPNWVGDVVMATPALRALRRHVGPDGQLIGVMRPYVSDVLSGSNWLDQKIYYDKHPGRFRFASGEVYRKLCAAKLDQVVLLTNSLRTAWMAWRSGACERIGYTGDARGWLLSTRLPRPKPYTSKIPLPTIDGYLRVVAAAGAVANSRRLELMTTTADELAADRVWNDLKLQPGERVIMLNSGGAYGVSKHWPAEYFAELARRLARGNGFSVLVNCGPNERHIAQEIVVRASDLRVVSLAQFERLPIGLTKACVRRSRLLVTTDSGPRFIAIAFGKPVVTLFGPTTPEATATHYELEVCLSLGLDCQPCMATTCPLGHHRCLRELSAEWVYRAVVDMLERTPVQGAA